ncbi:hypothetical protein BS47DRAFT_467352 [Hydnum rufescens UP504]|uniref:Uncharacterized protein n=1 Tax=Hydnum rufescens UP504 TaxID=1448309 RepID=A0A9P6B581_9AGAM|nr:hypothetical protein BS47DRAFT_467352 [Hydnum rufescens UP504]
MPPFVQKVTVGPICYRSCSRTEALSTIRRSTELRPRWITQIIYEQRFLIIQMVSCTAIRPASMLPFLQPLTWYNPFNVAVGASPRLNWVDERKMRMVTHAMSGFSGFAPTATLAVQQTQAAWKERVKALDLKPYVPPPSWALSSPDDPGIESTRSSETGMHPSDSEGTTSTLSTSVGLATSESEVMAEEEEELTPEELRELEERQRQTYLASRFAPAPAPPLRDLRQKAELPKSKAALRRQRSSEKKAEIEAALAPPTSATKTPTPTTKANPKNVKDVETTRQKAQKTSVQRQMKGLIASANKLGKQGSLVQQVRFALVCYLSLELWELGV